MNTPNFTPLVESLSSTVPFVGPETQERNRGGPFLARIGANENVFGPSPKAITAMQASIPEVWKYCDPENHELREALAAHHEVRPENIVMGEGIDGLQNVLVRMMVSEGTPVVTSLGAYPTFNFHVASVGGSLHTVPFHDDHEDIEALLATVKELNSPLFYLSNPDNPMGTWHSSTDIQSLINRLPDTTLLCLDEAYLEFAAIRPEPLPVEPPIDTNNRNVIRFRTFSKAYGMAGARIGYAIAHEELATAFNKIRNHFGVNRIAQIGALAALEDQEYLRNVVQSTTKSCGRIAAIAEQNNMIALPTATNFVAIDCGRDADYAKSVMNGLVERGIFVRMPFAAPQNRCIRITAGTSENLDLLERTLPQVISTIG